MATFISTLITRLLSFTISVYYQGIIFLCILRYIYFIFVDVDFDLVQNLPPFGVTFESNDTLIPIPLNLINDKVEEGYENFTLTLSYNEVDVDETVQIRTDAANVIIKDDDGTDNI